MGVEELIRLLLYLLVGGLIVYVVFWIIGQTTLSPTVKNIITLVVSVIIILWLIMTFFPGIAFLPNTV